MLNIQDLHIEKEILPLFDFTNNDFSKEIILDFLHQQLQSKEEILSRQEILKGFLANIDILKAYSYARFDMLEVHSFLEQTCITNTTKNELKLQLLFSEKERHQKRGKFTQLILLFEKIHTFYVNRINTNVFPGEYKKELQSINGFFSIFNLKQYELIIREEGLKTKHIVELTTIIVTQLSSEKIKQFWKLLFLFEAYLSISIGITKHGFTFPVFKDSTFSLRNFYHPILKRPVKNSINVSSNLIILTGPNMSGKSTFLKAVSLCVYLAHVGLAVPASAAEISFFDNISVAINLNDDILSGYSHFMTEVINLKTVATEAANDKSCFAVFDELFRGTNIEDAIEISTTTVKGLMKFKKSLFFISTHLHQLKDIEEVKNNSIATYYIDCELRDNSPVFTYKLKEGWSDLKVGRLLFEREGLNKILL